MICRLFYVTMICRDLLRAYAIRYDAEFAMLRRLRYAAITLAP